jgi:alpha-1,6-mannosyltransferase
VSGVSTQDAVGETLLQRSGGAPPLLRGGARSAHLVDVTMFWGASSGGVRRYINAKRRWLLSRTQWRHSTVIPAAQPRPSKGVLGLPSWPLPFAPGYRVARSRRRSAARIESIAPDIIEAGDPYNLAWAALDAGRALNVPVVAFAHSDLAALAARLGPGAATVAERYMRHLYERFDLVLAPGRALTQRLQSLDLGVPVRQQPLGVDTQRFHPAARSLAWRTALGLGMTTRVLLYAGRFAPEKNLGLLVEALRLLGPGYALVAIGGGPTPPPVDAGAARLIVLPFEPDERKLAVAMASCDLFVHAGDIETFGLVALEAMACGTPVVCRAGGALAELVDGQVGATVAGGAAQFAEAVAAVCSLERAALAAMARARAEPYDWDVVLPQLLGHYEQLIATHGAGRSADRTQLMALGA